MRASDQRLQREDLHVPLVLDGIRDGGERTESRAVAVPRAGLRRPRALRREPSSDGRPNTGSGRSPRRRAGAQVRLRLPAAGRSAAAATDCSQHGQRDDDGTGLLAVGQLEGQLRRHGVHSTHRYRC